MSTIFSHWARDIEEYGEKPEPERTISHTPDHHMHVIGETWTCPKCKAAICEIYIDYSIKQCKSCGWEFNWYHAISVDKVKHGIK